MKIGNFSKIGMLAVLLVPTMGATLGFKVEPAFGDKPLLCDIGVYPIGAPEINKTDPIADQLRESVENAFRVSGVETLQTVTVKAPRPAATLIASNATPYSLKVPSYFPQPSYLRTIRSPGKVSAWRAAFSFNFVTGVTRSVTPLHSEDRLCPATDTVLLKFVCQAPCASAALLGALSRAASAHE